MMTVIFVNNKSCIYVTLLSLTPVSSQYIHTFYPPGDSCPNTELSTCILLFYYKLCNLGLQYAAHGPNLVWSFKEINLAWNQHRPTILHSVRCETTLYLAQCRQNEI